MRLRRIDAALGARNLLRDAIGLSGTATSDLCLVLLGSTVRDAFGAQLGALSVVLRAAVRKRAAGAVCRHDSASFTTGVESFPH